MILTLCISKQLAMLKLIVSPAPSLNSYELAGEPHQVAQFQNTQCKKPCSLKINYYINIRVQSIA